MKMHFHLACIALRRWRRGAQFSRIMPNRHNNFLGLLAACGGAGRVKRIHISMKSMNYAIVQNDAD